MRRKLHTQHGITTREHLLAAGLSSETIQRWLDNGRLIRVHRGVYAVGHIPPSPHARTMAALLACGPTAVLSHRSAAKLWGLIRYEGPIEVTAANTRRRPGMFWPRHHLVGELVGHDTHEPRFEEDREKDADLLAHGPRVIRVTCDRLTTRPPKKRPGSNSSWASRRPHGARPARRAGRRRPPCPRTRGT